MVFNGNNSSILCCIERGLSIVMINLRDGYSILRLYNQCMSVCSYLIQAEWNKIKADKVAVDEYIKAGSGESDFTRECADDEIEAKVKDYGFELLPATQAPPTNKDSPTTDAQPSTSTSIFPHSFKALKLIDALCPCLNVLTDDVAKNVSFMSCIKASEGSILHFMKLRSMYAAKKRDQETQLKKDLEKVDPAIIQCNTLLEKYYRYQ